MKRFLSTVLTFFFTIGSITAAIPDSVAPVKNIILMIPDGAAFTTVSLARWYRRYLNPDYRQLAVDSLMCGSVVTYSSDAPIGDSAPTTSCYVTGMPSQTGFISTYPVNMPHDLVPVEPSMARRPLATIMEAGKWLLGKRSGLVVTCEFPHATPADCSAHSYSRKRTDWIAPQMVHLPVDIMFGGGTQFLSDSLKSDLKEQGIALVEDNLEAFRSFRGNSLWALFGAQAQPYHIDRDSTKVPSLAEMTQKALECLELENEKGFFLMVEGSKIDWAAHANDPVGVVTDMMAFDDAVAVALDFARHDGNTAIFVVPDHSTGGITIGDEALPLYDIASKDALFGHLSRISRTAEGMAKELNDAGSEKARELFRQYADIELNNKELNWLYNCPEYRYSPIDSALRKGNPHIKSLYSDNLSTVIASIYVEHLYIGFTTFGHTGEEVFMAAYHPEGTRPTGVLQNYEVNQYLCRLWNLEGVLPTLTEEAFAPLTEVFPNALYSVVGREDYPDYIDVQIDKRQTLRIFPFTRKMLLGSARELQKGKGKVLTAPNNAVWIDLNHMLYLHRSVAKMAKGEQ